MEDYKPEFGRPGDIVILLVLIVFAAGCGLLAGSAGVYSWIQHGALDENTVQVQAP